MFTWKTTGLSFRIKENGKKNVFIWLILNIIHYNDCKCCSILMIKYFIMFDDHKVTLINLYNLWFHEKSVQVKKFWSESYTVSGALKR